MWADGPRAVPTGFEPATSGLTGRRALQTAPRDHGIGYNSIRLAAGCSWLELYGTATLVCVARGTCGDRPRTPNGIRTRAATLKGWCPRPLDDGGKRRSQV